VAEDDAVDVIAKTMNTVRAYLEAFVYLVSREQTQADYTLAADSD
jgi:hypothetical protein